MRSNSRYKTIILLLAVIAIVEALIILHLLPQKPSRVVRKPQVKITKIAIVLDDWGYNLNNIGYLDEIKQSLTISVLPHLSYSKTVAYEAKRRGLEVILHLPLEPYPSQGARLEINTIMTNMDERRIGEILNDDLNNVPGASGISNHMGSKATGDTKLMQIIFKEMKSRGLYFLDSLVSSKSIGFSLSRKMGIRFARRDIFLDNNSNPEYIKGQIAKLQSIARRRGYAVGIGHDRPVTLAVLKEVMPQLEKEGYKFVFVSELAE